MTTRVQLSRKRGANEAGIYMNKPRLLDAFSGMAV